MVPPVMSRMIPDPCGSPPMFSGRDRRQRQYCCAGWSVEWRAERKRRGIAACSADDTPPVGASWPVMLELGM